METTAGHEQHFYTICSRLLSDLAQSLSGKLHFTFMSMGGQSWIKYIVHIYMYIHKELYSIHIYVSVSPVPNTIVYAINLKVFNKTR